MVDSSPQVMSLAIYFYEDLIQVPLPLRDLAHVAGAPHTDLAGEHRAETIDPLPNALVADVDPTLMEKVFDIPKRERKTNVHHHCQLDDLWGRLEIAERISGHSVMLAGSLRPLNRLVPLTMPIRELSRGCSRRAW